MNRKPTMTQLRRAMKLANVQIDQDSYGWFVHLGAKSRFTSEMSAMVGAYAELVRKKVVIEAVLKEKKRRGA